MSRSIRSPGVYLSRSYWIFSACRLKKHAYAGLPPSENHASQGKNVRTNTHNSAFPRALDMHPKYGLFSFQMNNVKFLSSGIARQHRIAHDDLSALLFYGSSNLRYYKLNNANV